MDQRAAAAPVSGPEVQFHLLGPLRVMVASTAVDLGGPRQRTVLAVLLTRPDRLVAVDQLIDAVWDGCPPNTAKRQIQNSVSALRRVLADHGANASIDAYESSYRIRLPAGSVDADAFMDLLAEADRLAGAGQAADAVDRLRAALALWRGPALLGLSGRIVEAAATRWTSSDCPRRSACTTWSCRWGASTRSRASWPSW